MSLMGRGAERRVGLSSADLLLNAFETYGNLTCFGLVLSEKSSEKRNFANFHDLTNISN